jgi:hypothetical protein
VWRVFLVAQSLCYPVSVVVEHGVLVFVPVVRLDGAREERRLARPPDAHALAGEEVLRRQSGRAHIAGGQDRDAPVGERVRVGRVALVREADGKLPALNCSHDSVASAPVELRSVPGRRGAV